MAFIELENIEYSTKKRKLNKEKLFNGLDLKIENNAFVTIIGDNGIGKTTLSKLIIGEINPDKGSVFLNGQEVKAYERFEIGKMIGYLFQNEELQLFCNKIEEELLFSYEFGEGITEEIHTRFNNIIKELSLEKVLKTPINKLSKGEKKRVAIGTILMNTPKFIILDEPTVGLDAKLIDDFRNIILKIYQQGIGILLISHDMSFIKSLPTKIYKISTGGIVNECNI